MAAIVTASGPTMPRDVILSGRIVVRMRMLRLRALSILSPWMRREV
jgi:hypothetical protein